ncbi:CinA family protein [Demequina sp. NBRC 110053]|uniref:CinA family protein n=1 Tax=Demequina sp. NBRC 110053 TaxID=1570342 RepID=UPI000A00D111|nr:CinA family protein [Demequina sp. NBRC 110053]
MPAPDDAVTAVEVVDAAVAAGVTVATAESLTGGALCGALVDVPGASATVLGGVVAYQAQVKVAVLGVAAEVMRDRGVVSEETAIAMARGVCDVTGAELGVSTTGAAGPDAHDGAAAGTVCIAVWVDGAARSRTLVLPGDRAVVRAGAVTAALALVAEALDERIGRSAESQT